MVKRLRAKKDVGPKLVLEPVNATSGGLIVLPTLVAFQCHVPCAGSKSIQAHTDSLSGMLGHFPVA